MQFYQTFIANLHKKATFKNH